MNEKDKSNTVITRTARADDEPFIVSVIPRLVEFGPPAWRNAEEMTAADNRVILETLDAPPEGAAIFIAEDENKTRLGFIHLRTVADYYTQEKHGHIADLVVASCAEGKGIGRILLAKSEDWARKYGFRWLTLSVFAHNARAKELYVKSGYAADTVKYLKEL